jgi:hypothetical protein
MAIDVEPNLSAPLSGSGNGEDSPKKGKLREGKKVCSYTSHLLVTDCRGIFPQIPEKRPEVRFLEVSEIPGINISPRFQRYLTAKKIKTDHPNGLSQESRSGKQLTSSLLHFLLTYFSVAVPATSGSSVSEASLLPPDALDNISVIASSDSSHDPSPRALQTHIADLEQEIRDSDFRLHFLYCQRLASLEMLHVAKNRAGHDKA